MSGLTPLLDHYLAEFARVERELPGADQPWAAQLRKDALQRFIAAGFPGSAIESWKYSDTRPLQKAQYELANTSDVEAEQIDALCPAELDAQRLVFINGRFSTELSKLEATEGLSIEPLSIALQSAQLESSLNQAVNGHGHALSDLNLAFAADGAVIEVADNAVIEAPIHLLTVSTGNTENSQMSQLRHIVRLGRNAFATVIEQQVSLTDDASYYSSSVFEATLADNAQLKRCRLQQESGKAFQVGATHARLSRDSRFHNHSVDLGGRWVRQDTVIDLAAPGAEIHLDGLYVPTGRQHMDNQTRVDHSSPHCISREDYKGILNGHARGVFNGKLVVHKDAQLTDSDQSSAALLLSGKAEVDAKPELEIYADDVKCAHGATVGQLDEQAVFYLQSRGVDEAAARNLLTYSFADELIQRVGIEPLRKHIEKALLAKLPNAEQLQELL